MYLESIFRAIVKNLGDRSSAECQWSFKRNCWCRKPDEHKICNDSHYLKETIQKIYKFKELHFPLSEIMFDQWNYIKKNYGNKCIKINTTSAITKSSSLKKFSLRFLYSAAVWRTTQLNGWFEMIQIYLKVETMIFFIIKNNQITNNRIIIQLDDTNLQIPLNSIYSIGLIIRDIGFFLNSENFRKAYWF